MFHLAIKGVRFNVARYVATLVAIVTGVAFFAAAGFASDRIISALEGNVTKQYGNVDTAVVVDDSKADAKAFAEQLRVPQDVVDEIADLPNVEGVAGELTGPVAFGRANGSTFADGAVGRLWIDDQDLNPVDVIEGKAPKSEGQIAIDKGLADKEGLKVGDSVTVLSVAGENKATIVGITEFGGDTDAIDQNGTVSIPAATAFDWLNSGLQEYKEVYVRGSGDQAALAKAVGKVIPAGFVAKTGAEFLDAKRGEVASWGKTLKVALQFFAVLALFVGGFVIYNTFSVIDRAVEELVVVAPGLEDVVVDVADGDRVADRRCGRGVAPGAEVDEEATLGPRVVLAAPGQELGAGELGHPLVGEDDRHDRAVGGELFQPGHRRRGGVLDHHLVVARVPLELTREVGTRRGVVVDGEQDGSAFGVIDRRRRL